MSSRITTCYQCDADNVNKEHVPPQCLFPKGGNWNQLITAPSCAEHNNKASQADEYLKFLLSATTSNAPTPVLQGAVRGMIRLAKRKSPSLPRYGSQWDQDTLFIQPEFDLDFPLLRSCLDKIARGLYFHHYNHQAKLRIPLEVHPIFIPTTSLDDPHFKAIVERVRSATANDFASQARLGGHPEIFAYQVIEDAEIVAINMEFYGAHWVSVMGMKTPRSTSSGFHESA